MDSLPYLTLDKDARQVRRSDVDTFASHISGGVLSAADDAYNEARKVWNATVAAPLLQFGEPTASALGPTPYAGFQTAFDPPLAPGGRNYWKSNNFSTLSDAALDLLIASAAQLPGAECEIFVAHLGGAMARVPPTATAFVGRDARYIMNVHGRWSDARDDERVRAWARKFFQDAAPHATSGGYVNFLTDDEAERVVASYGANHRRPQDVKQRYDPNNLFRMNLNVTPAAAPRFEASAPPFTGHDHNRSVP